MKNSYQIVLRNVEYKRPGCSIVAGELDFVGITAEGGDIFEVKSNDGYSTAVGQLRRAKEILGEFGIIRTFYYSARTREIKEII